MKRTLSFTLAIMFCIALIPVFAFTPKAEALSETEVLKVFNWEEYISIGEDNDGNSVDLVKNFEDYCKNTLNRNVSVEYTTFGTNENMYNKLQLSKTTSNGVVDYNYDLVCPSEYMIMKMIREDMLETIDITKFPNYNQNGSQYIKNLFNNITVGEDKLSQYGIPYMWGTLGFVINPETVDSTEASHWSLLWNEKYKGKGTIKDSMRDSYIMALGYIYADELDQIKLDHTNNVISDEEYNKKLTEIYNRVDDETIRKTGEALSALKRNVFGYEVDTGKKDMAQGKISINFAWSGDAVYTMDTAEGYYEETPLAEDEKLYLDYIVPEEGSNIWFDGWVMPKGANTDLASLFVDYLSTSENAAMNMNYIGYTSAIAGDAIFQNAVDNYGYLLEDVTANSDGTYSVTEDGEVFEVYPVDLSYFFGNSSTLFPSATIFTAELNRQFSAQYPDMDTVNRCTVMDYFSDEDTKKLNDMWESAKADKIPTGVIIGIIIGIVVLLAAGITIFVLYKKGKIFQPKEMKGYKITNIE